jgi:hypothetical protein
MSFSIRRSLPLIAVALAVTATVALAGPPWINIEYPANPLDPTTRDAVLVVNTYHHGTPTQYALTGTAEGIVRGERRTVNLRFTPTARASGQALTRQWPTEGRWVLHITLKQGDEAEAGALVVLGADGTPSKVTVPTRRQDQWVIPRAITAAEITAALSDAEEQRRGGR